MGTGDFICISMTGGAPWGFRLQGGKEQKQPLQVAKVSGEPGRAVCPRGPTCRVLAASDAQLLENRLGFEKLQGPNYRLSCHQLASHGGGQGLG